MGYTGLAGVTHGVLDLLPSLERSEWVSMAVVLCGVVFKPLAPATCLMGAMASAGPRLNFDDYSKLYISSFHLWNACTSRSIPMLLSS